MMRRERFPTGNICIRDLILLDGCCHIFLIEYLAIRCIWNVTSLCQDIGSSCHATSCFRSGSVCPFIHLLCVLWRAGIRCPAEVRDFSLLDSVKIGSGAHPTSYPMFTEDSFGGGNAAGAWSWPPPHSAEELYLHSPICLHSIVLNSLSTGATLPFYLYHVPFVRWRALAEESDAPAVLHEGPAYKNSLCLLSVDITPRGFECTPEMDSLFSILSIRLGVPHYTSRCITWTWS
jgi:hypothetical protein